MLSTCHVKEGYVKETYKSVSWCDGPTCPYPYFVNDAGFIHKNPTTC